MISLNHISCIIWLCKKSFSRNTIINLYFDLFFLLIFFIILLIFFLIEFEECLLLNLILNLAFANPGITLSANYQY